VNTSASRSAQPFVGADRRHNPPPSNMVGYLTQLPALELLSRLPVSVLGISDEGLIVYANEALLAMLGYVDTRRLYARPLTEITAAGSRCANPRDQIELLRSCAGTVTTWAHTAGHTVKALVSQPLLMRVFDPLLLVSLTDVTDWLRALDGRTVVNR
jgi:PAS domain-containing protein